MRGRLLFIVGIGAGYVVGSRAGRPAYDALVARLRRTTHDPHVQQAARKARETLEDRAPQVAGVVNSVAPKVADTVQEKAPQVADAVDDAAGKATGALQDAAPGAADSLADAASDASDAIEEKAPRAADAAVDKASDAADRATDAVTSSGSSGGTPSSGGPVPAPPRHDITPIVPSEDDATGPAA